jgi:uncharacterized membrane protein
LNSDYFSVIGRVEGEFLVETLFFIAAVVAFVQLYRLRGRMQRMERRVEQLETARWASAAIGASPRVAREEGIPEAKIPEPVAPPPVVVVAEPVAPPPVIPAVVPVAPPAEPEIVVEPEPVAVAAYTAPRAMAAVIVKPDESLVEEPEPAPAPTPPTPTPLPKPQSWSFNFEDLFGRRLPIWAGGITLAIAGVLIVKYAVDAGLLKIFTPWVRVVCGVIFGIGLIGGAEMAKRNEDRVDDVRVRQALSGAGIATLYAAILVAANVYHLIDAATAFVGLAIVTASALALSIRFGAPSAVLGLAGGLAAPAMVGGMTPNVPLLAVYLALTIAGLAGVSRMQRWAWLGMLALLGSAGWSLTMVLASGAFDAASTLSVGGLVLLLTVALPLLVFEGPRQKLLRSASALLGAAQLALMVALGGFAMLNWGLFILLAAAAQWLAWRDEGFAIVPSISLPLSVLLLAIWPRPALGEFALIGLALAVVHGGPLLWKLWQSPPSVQRAIELCGLAVAGLALPLVHYYRPEREDSLALVALVASFVPAIGIVTGWARTDRQSDMRFAWLTTTAAVLIGCAVLLALPHWLWPVAIAAIAAALLLFGVPARDTRIEGIASSFSGLALFGLLYQALLGTEMLHLVTGVAGSVDGHALIRWGGFALVFALFAVRAANAPTRSGAFGICGALLYGLAAQIVPGWSLPLALAGVAGAMLLLAQRRNSATEGLHAATFAAATIPLLGLTDLPILHEWSRLVGVDTGAIDYTSPLRWAVVTALGILFAIRAQNRAVALVAQVAAAGVGYGTFAQIVPLGLLPLVAPLAILGLAAWSNRTASTRMVPAAATLFAILGGWALIPVGIWARSAMLSLGGVPMIVDASLLPMAMVLKQLIVPALLVAGALALTRQTLARAEWLLVATITAMIGAVGVHTLYRLGFAQVVGSDFVDFGVAQRLVWAGLLIGLGWLVARRAAARPFAIALAATGTLHALWYSLFLHNPLWSMQAVGALPIVNLLIPLTAVPVAGVMLLRHLLPDWRAATERPVQLAAMAMVAGLSWALLRQAFHGSLLGLPGVTPTEDILRSLLAIVLAVGFLLWGIRAKLRDWRIASLFLMLAAVAKVFLLDASGLEGLLRIGSFVALGFSLIGIGWLYSRQLKSDAAPIAPPVTE